MHTPNQKEEGKKITRRQVLWKFISKLFLAVCIIGFLWFPDYFHADDNMVMALLLLMWLYKYED